MMRAALILGLIIFTAGSSIGDAEARAGRGGGGGSIAVRGYTTSRGTYVAPHFRSRPDGFAARPAYSPRAALIVGSSAAVAAAGTVVGMNSADAVEVTASTASQLPIEVTRTAVAEVPWCAPNRIVGSGAGFCLIN